MQEVNASVKEDYCDRRKPRGSLALIKKRHPRHANLGVVNARYVDVQLGIGVYP